MSTKKAKSFNAQVFEKTYRRLNLSPTERIIFFRLLGFLIRNKNPFPYSALALSELTGLDKRTIFRALNKLEKYRLIIRIGMGKNRRFCTGSILSKILTTVTNRMVKDLSTATLCHKNLNNRDMVTYSKTSLSLKHKDRSVYNFEEKSKPKTPYNGSEGQISIKELLIKLRN